MRRIQVIATTETHQRLGQHLGRCRHGVGIDRVMPWNRNDACAVGHDDMLALPRNLESGLFQRLDGALVRNPRDLPHLYRYVHFSHLSPGG